MLNWFKKKLKKEEVIEEDDKIYDEPEKEVKNGDDALENDFTEELPLEEIIDEEMMEDEDVEEESIDESEENIYVEEKVKEVEEIHDEENIVKKVNFFDKLKDGLTKTRNNMSEKIEGILNSYKKVDEELFDELEEVLVTADVGANTTMEIIDRLRERIKSEKVNEPQKVKELLKEEISKLMKESVPNNSLLLEPLPAVILVVGVNGVGKTTTIGKLANSFRNDGKKVLIAAGDTFRAAAIEQLEEWSKRSKVELIAHTEGADPAAVIFDGIAAAKARKSDILICDTAGRLHNKSNLMNELNITIVESELEIKRKLHNKGM